MTDINTIPYISLILASLPVTVFIIWFMPQNRHARWVALAHSLIMLLITALMVSLFEHGSSSFQFVEQSNWIPTLNIHYLVGVDGISLLFLPLTALLFCGVIISSWNSIRRMTRLYYSLLLLLQTATIGIFVSIDTILFFLFWELTLIPLYFLVSLWGIGPNRRYAAVKYVLFMLVGGVPLLFGIIDLALTHAQLANSALVFDYRQLLSMPLPRAEQTTLFILLLTGFAFKTPVFPFHTWLPTLAMEGPVAVAAIMTGIKLGAYGLIRFVVPLAPDAAIDYHWLLAGLGVVGIIYGAVLALSQTNIRRMLAFSSVSHVGLVVLGIASLSDEGLQGALMQLYNFTIIAGGLYILTGFMHHRIGSTDIIALGGAARSMPMIATFFLIFGLASMGLPLTAGFPAEFLIIMSALNVHAGAGLAVLFSLVVGAGYFINLYRVSFFGPMQSEAVASAEDLLPRELTLILILTLYVFVIGLFPDLVFNLTTASVEAWTNNLIR